jgi:hypothetical protein
MIRLKFSMQVSRSKSSNSGHGIYSEVCNSNNVFKLFEWVFIDVVNFDWEFWHRLDKRRF